MIKKIKDFSFIVVESELDALLLENNLIKKYSPRYNVALKDDKTFPWLCIKNERFPSIFPTRTKVNDGSEYFGPYASVKTMKTLLRLIRGIYKIRTCRYDLSESNITRGRFKVCLEYHLGNCLGPCEGRQTEKEYMSQIKDIREIIKGNVSGVIGHLEKRMEYYSERLEFELAQDTKNKIDQLNTYRSKSTIVNPTIGNVDVFGLVTDLQSGYVNYMKVVAGSIVQCHTITFKKQLEESDEELITQAIAEIKTVYDSLSKNLILPVAPNVNLEDHRITIPQRGDKKKTTSSFREKREVLHDRSTQAK